MERRKERRGLLFPFAVVGARVPQRVSRGVRAKAKEEEEEDEGIDRQGSEREEEKKGDGPREARGRRARLHRLCLCLVGEGFVIVDTHYLRLLGGRGGALRRGGCCAEGRGLSLESPSATGPPSPSSRPPCRPSTSLHLPVR